MLLAIDPGRHKLAYAVAEKGKILSAGLLDISSDTLAESCQLARDRVHELHWLAFVDADIYIELPVERVGSHVRMKDILDLRTIAGACAAQGLHDTAQFITPQEWTGNLDKIKVRIPRIKKLLTSEELSKLDTWAKPGRKRVLDHNVMDAIGIALWAIGRFKP